MVNAYSLLGVVLMKQS